MALLDYCQLPLRNIGVTTDYGSFLDAPELADIKNIEAPKFKVPNDFNVSI